MGYHFIKSAITMYNSVLISTILYNSQAWSNLTKADIRKLEVIQLKYLKRIVRAPQSTTKSFVDLEFGVLPLEYMIHMRQLTFLHHITSLCENDPVKRMFEVQKTLPFEKNWANNVANLLIKYKLNSIYKNIDKLSKASWTKIVKTSIRQCAFDNLKLLCKNKSKTKLLVYTSFSPQKYLFDYDTKKASVVFKLRARCADCKANRKSSVVDLTCRLCLNDEENQEHIINCPVVRKDGDEMDLNIINGDINSQYESICRIYKRYSEFTQLVNM